ncbi:MAG: hypothetical protein ABSB84_01475 [Verrucomicrobiota bacterium]|jgi:hypothetical protein
MNTPPSGVQSDSIFAIIPKTKKAWLEELYVGLLALAGLSPGILAFLARGMLLHRVHLSLIANVIWVCAAFAVLVFGGFTGLIAGEQKLILDKIERLVKQHDASPK